MGIPSIDEVWRRIEAHAGETFHTKTGLRLTYSVQDDVLVTSRAAQQLRPAEFAKVLPELPVDGPGAISNTVRGPGYIWAILHDPRIRQSDW